MTVLADRKSAETGWRAVLLEMLTGVRSAVLRFPVSSIFLLAAAVQANLLVANLYWFGADDQGRGGTTLVVGLMSGGLVALAASLSGEARGHSAMVKTVTAVAAGLAASVIVALPKTFLVLEWPIVPAFVGLVLVAPFIGRGDGASFWMFAARAAFAGFLGLLSILLLAGGISAILASLTYLFGLAVPDELYQHVWAFTGLFAAPLFALGQFPEHFDEQPGVVAKGFMDRGMRALGDFVAAPLLTLYAVILHLYALKIVVSGEVPEGQIGWLVLTYGLCIFGALMIINPFFDRARAPTRMFLRCWPFFLPIPLVLLFYALTLRVDAFGVTPERFLLGLFGLVTAIILLSQLFPRLRNDIRVMAALPVIALILGSFGPQGALGLSLASQTGRFLEIVKNPPVEGERHDEALAALSFLSGRDALSRVAPEGVEVSTVRGEDYRETAKAWGLDPDRIYRRRHGIIINEAGNPTVFAVDGFDVVIQNVHLSANADEPVSVRLPSGLEIAFALEEHALAVTAGEETVQFPITSAHLDELSRPGGEVAEIMLEAETRRLTLAPSYLYADTGEPPRLQNLDATIMLRARDWRP